MTETVEKKEIFRIKETFSVEEVNKMIKQGWILHNVKCGSERCLFVLIKV